jgi:hypothetical protein
MRDYSPFFPDDEKQGSVFNSPQKKPNTTNSTFYDAGDLYPSTALAEDRSYNIGCTGYRTVVISANGQVKFAPCTTSEQYTLLMKQMPDEYRKREYYTFDPRENLYDVREAVNDDVFEGFDYREQIFERTLSRVILKDPVKMTILQYFQRVVYGLIETTKQIKNFPNYTVKKNNRRVF